MGERPLWAPWRIEYVTSDKGGGCIFCGAAANDTDEPGHVVERGTSCFSMLNAYPYGSGHVMVVPYRHVGGLEDLDDAELLELMRLTRHTMAGLRTLMSPDGFNVGLNLGQVAGAGFADHLHVHVVPRWQGDTNFMPVLAGTHVISQALADTRRALAETLRTIG